MPRLARLDAPGTLHHVMTRGIEGAKYFGGITYSAVTKIGTRFKERMRDNERLRDEVGALEQNLSRVKG